MLDAHHLSNLFEKKPSYQDAAFQNYLPAMCRVGAHLLLYVFHILKELYKEAADEEIEDITIVKLQYNFQMISWSSLFAIYDCC